MDISISKDILPSSVLDSRSVAALQLVGGVMTLVDDFHVLAGDILTVNHGIVVKAQAGKAIVLDGGGLSILGYRTDPVRFEGTVAAPGHWMGIWGRPFKQTSAAVKVEACEIRDAVASVFLRFYSSNQIVRFCDSRNHLLCGVGVCSTGNADEIYRSVAVNA